MEQKKIENPDKIISSWINSSDENFETMLYLYKSKRYSWALFLGHLAIEKLMKAYFIKLKNEHAPNIHSLLRLAELSKLNLTQEQKKDFATITTFNINARYDDYKQSFFKKCTKEFTDIWIEKLKYYQQWIKELIK
jgi:HEPN domain-containing protein